MSEINYKDLDIKKVANIKTFEFNGKEIEVVDYISTDDKYDIVMITLQKSLEDGIYNPMKLDMYFHLNLVYVFTNIVFSDEDRADEASFYDELLSSGFMDVFLPNIDIKLYTEMQSYIEEISQLKINYNNSAAGIMSKMINDLPANAEAMQSIVENFDPDKYQAVVDFAKAANGGREIQ